MRDVEVDVVAMEVSSHGLERREVDGTEFAAVCFTNLSHEHLDFHRTMDAYFDAKARLFDGSFAPAAAINLDDDSGRLLAARVSGTDATLVTFGAQPDARFGAEAITYDGRGTSYTLRRPRHRRAPVRTTLVGPFNVSNALAAAATATAAGSR
jgi:UDP-N-acetylmuramoyl-L-alanyl-D-glutamate--2,6-diaminopimelate ligase